MSFTFSSFKSREERKSDIDKELGHYADQRKQAIDEEISEWRRSQKNRAVEDVVRTTEETRVAKQKMLSEHANAVANHEASKTKRATEIAGLDTEFETKKARNEAAERDFEARSAMRERLSKAEREAHDREIEGFKAVVSEKDATISRLEDQIKQAHGLTEKAVVALGEAASKDHSTKVVGFGHAIADSKKD